MSATACGCALCPYVARVSVTVVLPCLDEAAALPGVLAAVPEGWRALVVDNGSRDGSPELAARLGARHEVVADSVHSPAIEAPARTLQLLTDFWATVPARPRVPDDSEVSA